MNGIDHNNISSKKIFYYYSNKLLLFFFIEHIWTHWARFSQHAKQYPFILSNSTPNWNLHFCRGTTKPFKSPPFMQINPHCRTQTKSTPSWLNRGKTPSPVSGKVILFSGALFKNSDPSCYGASFKDPDSCFQK